jgi:hypothetical protein
MTPLTAPQPPRTDELVAAGDPLYSRLAAAARQGLLPGWQPVDFLRGDRLYTRRELAPLLERLPPPSKTESFFVVGNAPRGFLYGPGWQVQASKNGVSATSLSTGWRGWELSLERRPVRWGPSWSGGLLFSDSVPPLDQIRLTKTSGRFSFEQFYGQYFEANDPAAPKDTASGTRRHLAGRRLTLKPSEAWTLSAGEAIKALRLPDPLFAATLPWYVYEHDWSTINSGRWLGLPRSTAYRNSFWVNYMADLTVSYQHKSGTRLYGEYLLDDIKAPAFLGGVATTPQRSGLLLGAAGSQGPLRWCVEVLDTNRRTYLSDVFSNEWRRGDAFLGNPAGANAHQLFARADYKLRPGLALALENQQLQRRDRSQPGPTGQNRLTAFLAATLTTQTFATARLERDGVRLTLGWTP